MMSAGDRLTIAQSVAFALLAALEGEKTGDWASWAHIWLKGDDRSADAAQAAALVAATPAARTAAEAASLFDQSLRLETEAAMLESEGRNARWTLDTVEQRHAECLAAIAEALRLAAAGTLSAARQDELRIQAARTA